MTALGEAIAAQPAAVREIAGRDLAAQVATLAAARRVLLVGTGTSHHAAELGAAMLRDGGVDAEAVPSQRFALGARPPRDGDALVVLTHTGHTAYARRALREAADRGVPVVAVTGQGAGVPGAVETVPAERSETYTVSYTAAVAVLARLADGLGVPGTGREHLLAAADAMEAAAPPAADPPRRGVAVVGAGLAEVTAREGALKLREAGRALAAGFDAELFLHGSAVPYGPDDLLLAIGADPDGLLTALVAAARAEGVPTHRVTVPGAGGHPALDQLALTVPLQRLADRFAARGGHDPDTVITGAWAADALWELGAPGP